MHIKRGGYEKFGSANRNQKKDAKSFVVKKDSFHRFNSTKSITKRNKSSNNLLEHNRKTKDIDVSEERTFFTRKYVQKQRYKGKSNNSNTRDVYMSRINKDYCVTKTQGRNVEYCNVSCHKLAISVVKKEYKSALKQDIINVPLKSFCSCSTLPQWCSDSIKDLNKIESPKEEVQNKTVAMKIILETTFCLFIFPVMYVLGFFFYAWYSRAT